MAPSSTLMMLEAAALLAPFIAWDVVRYVLRRRGDRSPARRAALAGHFTDEEIEQGRRHVERHNRLFPPGRSLYYAFFAVLLFFGGAARLEALLASWTGDRWALTLPLFVLACLLAWSLLQLPLEAYREFVIQREAGLSTTTRRLWLADQIKGLVVGWALLSIITLPVLALLRGLPRHWPIPAAATVLAISACVLWISPWIIAPLFNRFAPLSDEALAARVRELTSRAGLAIAPGQVLVMDASRRSTYLNAYFSGLGSSRRVVLYDTLVEACSADEVLSVVAHELGHWRGRHILKLFALQSVGVVGGLWLLQLLLELEGFRTLFGLPRPASLAVLVLLPLVSGMAGTIAAPLMTAISRRFEREADQAALELAGAPQAFITLEQKLARRARADLLQPRLLHRWYGSHPLPEERIAAAERESRSLTTR